MLMPEDKIRKVLKIAKEPIPWKNRWWWRFTFSDFIEDKLELPLILQTSESLRSATHEALAGLTLRMKVRVCVLYRYEYDHTWKKRSTVWCYRERIRQIEVRHCVNYATQAALEVLRSLPWRVINLFSIKVRIDAHDITGVFLWISNGICNLSAGW